jgi:hypothetical protein
MNQQTIMNCANETFAEEAEMDKQQLEIAA